MSFEIGNEIENEAAYAAKIHGCMTNPCTPTRCRKCGREVGWAVKSNGTRYLAEIERTPHGANALKIRPHFVECTGVREPGVVVVGIRVRVVCGRKVPIGTEGIVVWMGAGQYGERVGIKDDAGTVFWTALKNVDEAL